jgi:AcrR family transcriptional regulator
MKHASPLIAELKRALKEGSHTYADVATALGLSVASVKRLFSSGNFSLRRVEQVCELAGVDLVELATRARDRVTATTKLSLSQEQEIVADPKLFLMTWLVLNRTPFEEIVRDYALAERDVLRYLILLDRLRIIDLLPGNRVKLLVDGHFNWRSDGPIQAYVFERLLQEFFATRFASATDEFYFHGGAVSESALAQLKRTIRTAAGECVEMIERDRRTSAPRSGAAFVMAIRPWRFSGFAHFLRG